MKRLLGYLRQHLAETILAPVFKMLEASFESIQGSVIRIHHIYGRWEDY